MPDIFYCMGVLYRGGFRIRKIILARLSPDYMFDHPQPHFMLTATNFKIPPFDSFPHGYTTWHIAFIQLSYGGSKHRNRSLHKIVIFLSIIHTNTFSWYPALTEEFNSENKQTFIEFNSSFDNPIWYLLLVPIHIIVIEGDKHSRKYRKLKRKRITLMRSLEENVWNIMTHRE